MKSAVFWDVKEEALYSLYLLFYSEDGGIAFIRKISELPDYMGLYPKDNILLVCRQLVALLFGDRHSARPLPTFFQWFFQPIQGPGLLFSSVVP
jgi:hypothetical protein